jgi:tetratricopeptide (TPR) repeat protein
VADVPHSWHRPADDLWQNGQRQEAINALLAEINREKPPKAAHIMQFVSYLFALNDFRSAAHFLKLGRAFHPEDLEILLNLGIALGRAGSFYEALGPLQDYLAKGGKEVVVFDALASNHHMLGNFEEARRYGRASLEAKDLASTSEGALRERPADVLSRPKIIAFTLWGSNPRYLRGALQNAERARQIYPGWTCRFYIDSSVPVDLSNALRSCGAEVAEFDSADPAHLRLCRRFLVSDDPEAGYFIVRDSDSVISDREAAAVGEWLSSGKPFHVMRDWWTHTDTMLAGMWGGIAGVLPPMAGLIESYRSAHVVTANWDQWFLRDRIWGLIKNECLVHDRFFQATGGRPFPTSDPKAGRHVGQDEFAVRRVEQEGVLAPWAERVPSLQLPSERR